MATTTTLPIAQIAIIGGSGLSQMDFLAGESVRVPTTPFGEPSAPFLCGEYAGKNLVFLERHGVGHTFAPHSVNYRANLWALQSLGVKDIYAVAATGGIPPSHGPQTIVIPHQVLDYTYGREHTYFDGVDSPVQHVDFTLPYTEALRQRLINAANQIDVPIVSQGVYAATQGPRLETAAEVDRLERDGATIIGMTGMPEASLARELEMNYACISLVVNLAAGRSDGLIALEEIHEVMRKGMHNVVAILKTALAN